MLGVGPGFLLLPTLILLRYEPKHAAAINALAVTPPSFSALIPHIATARVDLTLAAILIVVGALGYFLGAPHHQPLCPRQAAQAGLRGAYCGDDRA
jgi:uncharacterized membrane protein YfcA